MSETVDPKGLDIEEKVVNIRRVAKVTKGGKRFHFTALVVVGDGNGHVGAGTGKSNEVPEAIKKAVERAKKNLVKIPRRSTTIPHENTGIHVSTRVLLKPAAPGAGVIAGGAVRSVLELAGIHDILTKVIGSTNPLNVVYATINGLQDLKTPEQIAAKRGIEVSQLDLPGYYFSS